MQGHRNVKNLGWDICTYVCLEFLVIYTNYQKGRVKNLSKSGGDHYPHVPISSGVPAIEAMTEQRPPTGGC